MESYLPIFALGVAAVAVVAVAYYLLLHARKVVPQLVESIEAVKPVMSPLAQGYAFGVDSAPGALFAIQSRATEKVVAKERAKLANKASPLTEAKVETFAGGMNPIPAIARWAGGQFNTPAEQPKDESPKRDSKGRFLKKPN